MYMSGFLIGVIIAMIYSSYKESRNLQDQIDNLKSRQNIYEEKLKSLFYNIKDKN